MQHLIAYAVVASIMYANQLSRCCISEPKNLLVLQMLHLLSTDEHLMVDLATLLVSSCSIYLSLVFFGVCGSSERL